MKFGNKRGLELGGGCRCQSLKIRGFVERRDVIAVDVERRCRPTSKIDFSTFETTLKQRSNSFPTIR